MKNTENIKVYSAIQQAFSDAKGGTKSKKFQEFSGRVEPGNKIDGFHVNICGDLIEVNYECQASLLETRDPAFLQKVQLQLKEVVDYLKSDFKKRTKSSLMLKKYGDPLYGNIQYLNNYRCMVTMTQKFKVQNIQL